MHIARGLEITEDVVLKFWNRLEEIRDVLVLLDVANDLGGLRSLVEIDQFRRRERGYTILNERQIRQVDT